MRILFLTSGWQVSSSRFRVLQFIPRIEAAGHVCVIAPSIPPKYRGFWWLGNRASELPRRIFRTWDLLRAWWQDYDVVFVERELFSADFYFLERMFRRVARTLVYDVDDAIFEPYPEKFEMLVRTSDCVLVGNRLLEAKVAAVNPLTVYLPTVVDVDRCVPRALGASDGHRLVIGWTGLASNIPYLEIVAESLRELAQLHDFEFQVVAEDASRIARLDLAGVRVRFVPWSEEDELDVLRRLDVGIMPLPDNNWTRHKCGYKLIQYMALAIPGVASPVGANCEIVRHGETGYLAQSPSEWTDCLGRLLGDAALRRTIGQAGRAEVAARFSLNWAAPRLIQALEQAVARSARAREGKDASDRPV